MGPQSDRPKIAAQWPLSADKNAGPGSVVGEVHHPGKTVEIRNPSWLIIPERGFYTGVAIFCAVESGKTSACMQPLAQQICPCRPPIPSAGLAYLRYRNGVEPFPDARALFVVLSLGELGFLRRTIRDRPLGPEDRRSSTGALALAVEVVCPVVHQDTPTFKEVRPAIGRFHLVLDHVSQGCLDDLAWTVCFLGRPVAET